MQVIQGVSVFFFSFLPLPPLPTRMGFLLSAGRVLFLFFLFLKGLRLARFATAAEPFFFPLLIRRIFLFFLPSGSVPSSLRPKVFPPFLRGPSPFPFRAFARIAGARLEKIRSPFSSSKKTWAPPLFFCDEEFRNSPTDDLFFRVPPFSPPLCIMLNRALLIGGLPLFFSSQESNEKDSPFPSPLARILLPVGFLKLRTCFLPPFSASPGIFFFFFFFFFMLFVTSAFFFFRLPAFFPFPPLLEQAEQCHHL